MILDWKSLVACAIVDAEPTARYVAGTHLCSPRKGGAYTHHGIYVGGGQVIHHSGWSDERTEGKLEQVSLEEFRRGYDIAIVEHRGPKPHWSTVVSRAKRALKDPNAPEWQYSAALRNCEHFATWCVTGQKHSTQVDRVIRIVLGPVLGPVYAYFRD